MIIDGSRLHVSDNSGAKEVECIKTRGRFASIGDIITCSVKKAGKGKVTQGQVVKAVIVETKKQIQRKDGSVVCSFARPVRQRVVKFDKNACVLVNAKGQPVGTRVLGFVTHELRARQLMKVLSLAARVF
ncbi:hypothetical protein N2152v2_000261 [Parachlorella kessleri]